MMCNSSMAQSRHNAAHLAERCACVSCCIEHVHAMGRCLSHRSELNVPAEAVQTSSTTTSGNVPAMLARAAR